MKEPVMNKLLQQLSGGLVASCQPVDDGPMDRPEIVAAMAAAAVAGGAAGLRIEGVANLRAARAVVEVPIIGIVKSDSPDTPVRITVTTDDVEQLIAAGADIVAYDATDRPRTHDRDAILQAILDGGALAMADCSTLSDGQRALEQGASILGSTLSGYTEDTKQNAHGPDFDLISAFRDLGAFVMAEGRCDTPALSAATIRAGAHAVTVGSALTRLEIVTARFADAIRAAGHEGRLTGFAVDLGGTKTAAARIKNGQIVAHRLHTTDGAASPADQLGVLCGLLDDLGYQSEALLGVAVTGRVDRLGDWFAVNQATLSKIDAVPLSQMLAAKIGPARVINDAAAATLAEHRLGAGRGHENFAYITVSTGVGGGLVLNNSLHQSPNGMAGHIGFTSAIGGKITCGSGRFGTVESLASGRAIAALAAEAGHPDLDARAVFDAAGTGAAWAERVIETSANAVAELVANLVATLGVTQIAIGGGVGLADGYVDRVRRHLSAMPVLFHANLTCAELGQDGPLLGALLAANAPDFA